MSEGARDATRDATHEATREAAAVRREAPLIAAGAEPLEPLAPLAGLEEMLEVGVLTVDSDLVVRGCNRWLATAMRTSAAEVVGRPLLEVFPELRGTAAEGAFQRALGGATIVWSQQFHGHLLPLAPAAGHEGVDRMQQSARLVPLQQGDRVRGVLAIVHDVTERVVREQALRVALQRAEVANQAKSDFLASMSHELRTPLGAIIGYMDLLEGEIVGPVAPIQKDYLGRVKGAARHLIHIIEEILTFSRVEAGKEVLDIESVDAAALARDVAALFEPQARKKDLRLVIACPDATIPMVTDATKLRQILINLLGNAVKFTDAGEVGLALQCADDRVMFHVRDTGPGMLATDTERIFDPFTQLDQSLKRVKGGTGLGLPVSRRLARLLGGDLTVTSRPNEGATFTLSLPREPGKD
jgi:signal transduction histidine kinase